jgi:hypothetical protein
MKTILMLGLAVTLAFAGAAEAKGRHGGAIHRGRPSNGASTNAMIAPGLGVGLGAPPRGGRRAAANPMAIGGAPSLIGTTLRTDAMPGVGARSGGSQGGAHPRGRRKSF